LSEHSLRHAPPPAWPAPPAGRTGWPWEGQPPERPAADGGPLISIITPSYNQAAFIEQTVRSVLLQDYARLEYIVMDGGSTDGTLEVLRRYAPWLQWTSAPDGGQADAINQGLRRATGQVVAYLNSDDLYWPGALSRVAQFLAERPEVGVVYGDCLVIDAEGRPLGHLPRHTFDRQRMIERGEFIPQPAAFWRRAVSEQVGAFDPTLHLALDHDFFIRASGAFTVAYRPQTLAAFRLHGGSKTVAREEQHWRESLAVSERHGLRPWHAWYWLRRLRHYGLRALPGPAQRWLRRQRGGAQDTYREQLSA
jgi:glycosyltransferase involved in cell wall biosynthesis